MADRVEYREAIHACAMCSRILQAHDLQGMLDAIEHAHTTGPILDPTLYREKVGAMEEDAELLRVALKLRDFNPRKDPRR